ncbi:hypothetical protein [Acerihabitans sp.]|uniref:hypothetical protein n=1 Tax=Acerihabitans sp. TaxID=2811394 RepID=UPI002EDB76E8
MDENIKCNARVNNNSISQVMDDGTPPINSIKSMKSSGNSHLAHFHDAGSRSNVNINQCVRFSRRENMVYGKLNTYMQKLKKSLPGLNQGRDGKNITIIIDGEAHHNTYFKQILLIEGEISYAAYVAKRWVVSDGDAYYIEDLMSPPAKSSVAVCLELIAQLVAVTGFAWHDLKYGKDKGRAQAPVSTEQSSKSACDKDIPRPETVFRPFGFYRVYDHGAAFLQGFLTIPSAWAEEMPASLETKKTQYAGRISKRSPAPGLSANDFISHPLPQIKKETHKNILPFSEHIACNTEINLPNDEAMKTHTRLVREYNNQTSIPSQTLKWLDGYDRFLAIKVKNIFDQALYLKRKEESLDIIILKRYCEKIFESCRNINPSLFIHNDVLVIDLEERVMLDDFFTDMNESYRYAFKNINLRILREIVALKNGMTFEETKDHLKERHDSQIETADRELYKSYFKYLSLMERSHSLYSDHLEFDDKFTPLERSLYHNNKNLYMSLIDDDIFEMENLLIVRFFLYIFEYNRNNGVSIQGNNLFMPGEFTDLWYLFSKLPDFTDIDKLSRLFIRQILDFNNREEDESAHLQRVMKLIEFVHMHFRIGNQEDIWQQDNIKTIDKCIELLEDQIVNTMNLADDAMGSINHQWKGNEIAQIIYDKECVIFLSFLKDLQQKFDLFMTFYYKNNINLSAKTHAQRLVSAKIEAVKLIMASEKPYEEEDQLLIGYQTSLKNGDINLLIGAATFWFLDYYHNNDMSLRTPEALTIVREFQQKEILNFIDLKSREQENFTSIFDLSSSKNFADPNDYFDQFLEYRLHDAFFEAKNITFNIIKNSELSYVDLIFPPKYIYSFQIYSRKYLQNTLVPFTWVSTPEKNLGYILIVKTRNNKRALISTLLCAPFTRMIGEDEDENFIIRIIHEWSKTLFNLEMRSRHKISANITELYSLLYFPLHNDTESIGQLNQILIAPEENEIGNPMPEFILVADKSDKPDESLLSAIDYWNEKTLIDTATVFKEELRDKTWVDYLTSQIPFYEVLWNNWYDPDFEFSFKDIIFDVFDIVTIMVPVGSSIKKITKESLAQILVNANKLKIPTHTLRRYIINSLIKASPGIVFRSAREISVELLSFFNPVPFSGVIESELTHFLSKNYLSRISWINDFLFDSITSRKFKLKSWSAEIDRGLLALDEDGLFSMTLENEYKQRYIEIDRSLYQVFWDSVINNWRVVEANSSVPRNNAIPIEKTQYGHWSASLFHDKDPVSPLQYVQYDVQMSFSWLNKIKFEPFIKLDGMDFFHVINRHTGFAKIFAVYIENFLKCFKQRQMFPHEKIAIIKILTSCMQGDTVIDPDLTHALESGVKDKLHEFADNFVLFDRVSVKYRSVMFWSGGYDYNPLSNIVIEVIINKVLYIIDLSAFWSPVADRLKTFYVFQEKEWYLSLLQSHTDKLTLIKNKTFRNVNEAHEHILKNSSPGQFSKGVSLIQEPVWYKAAVIRQNLNLFRRSTSTGLPGMISALSATRMVMDNDFIPHPSISPHPPDAVFPLLVLTVAEWFDQKQFSQFSDILSWAVKTAMPLENYMSSDLRLKTMEDLLRVKEGKFLAALSQDGILKHFSISVGNGRFAGKGNNFFNYRLSPNASIVVAEEMGTFSEGYFYPRADHQPLRLVAGNPLGRISTETVLLDSLPYIIAPKSEFGLIGPQFERRLLSRERVLLGQYLSVFNSGRARNRLKVIIHTSDFKTNFMSSQELVHIIRAMIYIDADLPDLNALQSIEMLSCFDGYDGFTHTGQVIADEFQVQVDTYPYWITDAVMARHPQWFTTFNATQPVPLPDLTSFNDLRLMKRKRRVNLKKERLHDLVGIILHLRKIVKHSVTKRSFRYLPSVYINIARYLINDLSCRDLSVYHHLSDDSRALLENIKTEYDAMTPYTDDIYIQCYFDILYAIAEFKHLIKWITPSRPQRH